MLDEARKSKATGGRAAASSTADFADEKVEGFEKIDCNDEKWDHYSGTQILAIIRKSSMKQPEGKGKGKDIGLRKCFECDSDSHIAAECPKRESLALLREARNGCPKAIRPWETARARAVPRANAASRARTGRPRANGEIGTLEKERPSPSQDRRGWDGAQQRV